MSEERTIHILGEDQAKGVNLKNDNSPNGISDTCGKSERTTRQNPRELDDARYAALDCRAHSDQARALVSAVTDLVVAQELAAGTRTNKRKRKQTALTSAVGGLLADLLQAQISDKAKGYVYRSMRPSSFTEGNVSYRVFKALVDTLVDLALLEKHPGFQVWDEAFGKRTAAIRKATRFQATQ